MIETVWQGIAMNREERGSDVSEAESEKESNHMACEKSTSACSPPHPKKTLHSNTFNECNS
jgi:hypothetical protein